MMQCVVLQVIGLLLVIIFPEIALWLPSYLAGGK
jgi:TRAP-type mannitol/chloroaromatic compound transport system permease large subunit